MKNKLFLKVLFFLGFILLISGCSSKNNLAIVKSDLENKNINYQDIVFEEKNKNNKIFSKFTAPDLNNIVYNEDIIKKNKITIINIWGTFCPPCLKELPELEKISEKYKDKKVKVIGIVVDAVSQDGSYSNQIIKAAKNITKKTGVTYLNLLPSKDLISSYLVNVKAVPQTLIVDSNGNLIKTIVGGQHEKVFTEIIDEELSKTK